MNPDQTENNQRLKVAGIVSLFVLAFAVYWPIVPGSFLMDDARWTGGDNVLVNGTRTLVTLWFHCDFTLSMFGWWLEHLMFQSNPAGYHIVNILLHATSGVLLWRLLKLLKIPGAWLAGALFVVHPVCVNSVARISELKNTLSMPFFLLSLIGYLLYEALALYPAGGKSEDATRATKQATKWYVVSVMAFVLALMAKTSVVMLPLVLLLCAAWQRRRIGQKDVVHTLPFFVLALAFGLMSIWFQKYQALPSAEQALQPASFAQRLAGAGYDFWFYLGKALFPFNLILQYPEWNIDAGTVTAYVPDLLVGVAFGVCAWFHKSWGRHGLFALGCFGVLLFPSLGFFDAQFLTMWQVSDHLQYTALAAIVALVAAVVARLPSQMALKGVAGALVLVSAVLCMARAEVFKTQESLMADTIAKNPEAAGAHNDLGIALAEKGNLAGAIDEFNLAIKYDPENTDARVGLGHALMVQGKLAEAEKQYQDALRIRPHAPQTHKMYALLLRHEARTSEALYHLQMAALFKPEVETYMDLAGLEYATGQPERAVAHLKQAVAFRPDPAAMNNLAWILATCPDDSVRNGKEALGYALEACRLTNFKQAGMMGTLAAAYAETGDFPEAVETSGIAANLAMSSGDRRFAAANQQLMNLYKSGKPYHEKPFNPAGR